MKRAARHKTGSVVFDKRRKTWNFLWWEEGKRHSKLIGTRKEFRTKGAAQRQVQSFRPDVLGQPSESPKSTESGTHTVQALAARYERERLPSRHSTARMYRSWLRNHILPKWGDSPISEVQPTAGRTVVAPIQFVTQKQIPCAGYVASAHGVCHVEWCAGDFPKSH